MALHPVIIGNYEGDLDERHSSDRVRPVRSQSGASQESGNACRAPITRLSGLRELFATAGSSGRRLNWRHSLVLTVNVARASIGPEEIMRQTALVYINGRRYDVAPADAGMMLADFLRLRCGLTGTKIVCAEGDCGACTVLRSFPGPGGGDRYLPMNSCIALVAQLDGSSLVTVDALADERLTPVQSSMMSCHGSQCGFCTPGFVMALTGLVEKKLGDGAARSKGAPKITAKEARNALTGNLCRCTGYQPILDAAVSIPLAKCEPVAERFSSLEQSRDLKRAFREGLHLKSESFELFAPRSLKEAALYLKRHRDARVLGAATDLGVVHNKWKARLVRVVSLHLVPELYEMKRLRGNSLSVGARVTLSELRSELKSGADELARFLDLFASPQIKNVATLVGNVANASPIADTPPFLLVSDAVIDVVGPRGRRSIPIERFYLGYRETDLRAGELIKSIRFSLTRKNEILHLKKISERKDLDISAVNAAFRLSWRDRRGGEIGEARIALGGVAATPLRLVQTEAVLKGLRLDDETREAAIEKACAALQAEIAPIGDVRGSSAFRRVLAENLFRDFINGARR